MSEVTTWLRLGQLPQRGEHLGLGAGVRGAAAAGRCGSSWAPPGRSARRGSPRRARRACARRPRGAARGGDRRTWWRGSGRASRSPGGVDRLGPPLSPALQRCLTPVVLWPERFRGGCTFGARPPRPRAARRDSPTGDRQPGQASGRAPPRGATTTTPAHRGDRGEAPGGGWTLGARDRRRPITLARRAPDRRVGRVVADRSTPRGATRQDAASGRPGGRARRTSGTPNAPWP